MKLSEKKINFRPKKILPTALILLLILGIFAALFVYAHEEKTDGAQPTDYAEYETGTVLQILTDSCEADEVAEGAYRGNQTLLVEVTSGQYKGETLLVTNAVGPMYGEPAAVGQSIVMTVSTYSDGSHTASVYEYNRTPFIYLILGLFLLVTVLVGGKTGVKSILGLALTVAMLLLVFLPLLMKGWQPIPTAFLLCSLVAIACFVILGGCSRKIACACMGTVAGMALAMLFGILAQKLLHIDGLRATDAEALLQLRQTGTPVHIRGLLVAGVIISALGAVMDVAMSVSSAIGELKAVNPELTARALWRSGMNIGRDMVGTMTNTLILAILGSSTVLILYLYSLDLSWHQLMSSSYIGIEIISSVSSAIGVILAVPLTALVSALLYGKKRTTAHC
ncbi:MAG: YibE/F family protein [Firmicutes bacterium]|nr:YibE/F family protein [Bacillota bacterium]